MAHHDAPATPVTTPSRPVVDLGKTEAELAHQIASLPHGKVPRDLRRRHALLVGTEMFLERGYGGTAMDEVAGRCGISKPVLYDLVGSKEQFFADVMARSSEELADRVATAVTTEVDDAKKIYAGALAFFRFVEERHDAWRTLLAPGVSPTTAEVARIRVEQVHYITQLLTTQVARGGIERHVAVAAAHAFVGANEALASLWQTSEFSATAEELASLVTQLFLPGLTALGTASDDANDSS